MRISDWSSDVCSSDLFRARRHARHAQPLLVKAAFVGIISLQRRTRARMDHNIHTNRSRDGIHRDVIMGRTNAAGREEIIVAPAQDRSEEHTSELQSLMRISYAVFCLKKKKQYT